MSSSLTLCAVAKKALGSSKFSGENIGVNSAWYLILEAIDAASCVTGSRAVVDSRTKDKQLRLKQNILVSNFQKEELSQPKASYVIIVPTPN